MGWWPRVTGSGNLSVMMTKVARYTLAMALREVGVYLAAPESYAIAAP